MTDFVSPCRSNYECQPRYRGGDTPMSKFFWLPECKPDSRIVISTSSLRAPELAMKVLVDSLFTPVVTLTGLVPV